MAIEAQQNPVLPEAKTIAPAAVREGLPKPRVCYLRSSYLNVFEAQYLRILKDQFEIIAVHPRSLRYDISKIGLPARAVHCVDYIDGLLPRSVGGHALPNPLKQLGMDEMYVGLKSVLSSFDVVHSAEQCFYFTWQVARLKEKLGFKLIVIQDEINPFWYSDRRSQAKRCAFVRAHADLFHARSERAATALVIEGVDPKRIRVISHGVDTQRFAVSDKDPQALSQLGIDPGRFIIFQASRLMWTKGLWALADAAACMLREPDIKELNPLFVIAGSGNDQGGFEKRLRQLGVFDSFKLLGDQPYDRLPMLHQNSDIFVMPSISTRTVIEQFGIALIEAIASGKPVVSTYCGAIDEVVADAGLLVQPNDALRLSEALTRLCRDERLRCELGERGRRRVEDRFSHNVISDKIALLYSEALGA